MHILIYQAALPTFVAAILHRLVAKRICKHARNMYCLSLRPIFDLVTATCTIRNDNGIFRCFTYGR